MPARRPVRLDQPQRDGAGYAVFGKVVKGMEAVEKIRETPPGANGEVQITDAILRQAQEGCVLAYKFKGRRFDCGSVDGFVEATNYCYENIYKS